VLPERKAKWGRLGKKKKPGNVNIEVEGQMCPPNMGEKMKV
jgi:hypothetical protein